jgi:hypothetical protein
MTKGTWIVLVMGMAAMIGCVQEPVQAKKECKAKDAQKDKEVKITIDQVPAPAKKTILAEAGKNKIVEIEKETEDGGVFYEAKWLINKKAVEIKVTPDGKLVEKEFEISMNQVPESARKTIQKEAGSAKIKEIEKVLAGGKEFYEAEWKVGNKKIEVKVAPNGKLLDKEVEVKNKKLKKHKGDDDEKEVEVTIDQVPAAVKKTILSQAGKNKIEEIEKETKKGKVTFEAEWTEGEMEVEIKVAPNGKLLKVEKELKDNDDDDDDEDDDDDK